MSEKTAYQIENTSFGEMDNRGVYKTRKVYFGNLPRDYETITFYDCLLVSDVSTDVFGVSKLKTLKNVELRVGDYSGDLYTVLGADISGSKMENVQFLERYTGIKLVFEDCDFRNCVFKNCDGYLYFLESNLSNAKIEGDGDFEYPLHMMFAHSNLKGCIFEGVRLTNIRQIAFTDFSGAVFKRCSYIGYIEKPAVESLLKANIHGLFVNDYRFKDKEGFWYLGSNSNLEGADFRGLNYQYPNFNEMFDGRPRLEMCNLRNSIFDELDFGNDAFYFVGSDLRDSSLQSLRVAVHLDFAETDMRGTSLSLFYRGYNKVSVSFLWADFDANLFADCIEFPKNLKYNDFNYRPIYFVFSVASLSEELLDVFGIDFEVSEICGPNAQRQIIEKNKNKDFMLRGSKVLGVELVFLGRETKIASFSSAMHLPNGFDWSNSEITSSNLRIGNRKGLENVNFSNSRFRNSYFYSANNSPRIHDTLVLQNCDFSNCLIDGHLSFAKACLKQCDFTNIKGHTVNFNESERDLLLGCSFAHCDLKVFYVDAEWSTQRPSIGLFDFSGAKIENLKLGECDFYDTNFSGCHIIRGEIEESEIERCDFRGAVFGEGFSFDSTTFTDCVYDQHTKMNLEDWQWEGMTFVES